MLGSQKKVLIVDDEPSFITSQRRVLESLGLRVFDANNVAEALVAMGHGTDLVITDNQMPEGNGTELIRRLRDTTGLNYQGSIIFISGTFDQTTMDWAKPLGVICLEKPLNVPLYIRTVTELLGL